MMSNAEAVEQTDEAKDAQAIATAAAESGESTEEKKDDDKKEETPSIIIKDVTEEGAAKEAASISYTNSFVAEWTDPNTKILKVGTFQHHRLTVSELGQVGVQKAFLNGGQDTVDGTTSYLHEMIAHCRIALDDSPEWFDMDKLYDTAVLRTVYAKLRDWEATFR